MINVTNGRPCYHCQSNTRTNNTMKQCQINNNIYKKTGCIYINTVYALAGPIQR